MSVAGALGAQAQVAVLHSFESAGVNVPNTISLLPASGTRFYGTCQYGGVSNLGAVFKMDTNGANFAMLHEFTGSDGGHPAGQLIQDGGTFYGSTREGGGHSGTVFKIKADGSGFTTLYTFLGGNDGAAPCYLGAPVLAGASLLGTTLEGGNNNLGTLFRLSTNGAAVAYSILHHFAGGAGDAGNPAGVLVQVGATLYGTSMAGGSYGAGTVFKIGTNGTGVSVLHAFSGSACDGADPVGGLALSGSSLYGFTVAGGISNAGTLFRIGTNGTGYAVVHQFTGAFDGAQIYGVPCLRGPVVYGFAAVSGSTAFLVNTNGTGFKVLHRFAGGTGDGSLAVGPPVLLGASLFGTAALGGANGGGLVFRLPASAPQLYFQNAGGTVVSWQVSSTGTLQTAHYLGEAGVWDLKAVGDLNGDGVGDLIFQNPNGDVVVWFMNADSSLMGPMFYGNAKGWEVKAWGDVRGNGGSDILFQNAAGMVANWQMTLTTCSNIVVLSQGSSWQLKAAGDLDGDRKAELFWQNAAGQTVVWFRNPDGSFRPYLAGSPLAWGLCGADDLDGDGISDLAWQNAAGTTAYWFMNADGTPRLSAVPGTAAGWKLKGSWR